jgi:hypothetical protein
MSPLIAVALSLAEVDAGRVAPSNAEPSHRGTGVDEFFGVGAAGIRSILESPSREPEGASMIPTPALRRTIR